MTAEKPDTFRVEIPPFLGFGGGTVTFTQKSVQYGKKRFAYEDIQSVNYSSMSSSLNFIPTDQIYSFNLKTKKDRMKITMETRLKIGDDHLQAQFQKLVSLSKRLVEPVIVARYLKMIFSEGYTIEIQGVKVNKKGFTAGGHSTGWTDGFYLPEYARSKVVIFAKDTNGRPQIISGIPITWDNACLLPELFEACAVFAREMLTGDGGERQFPGQEPRRNTAAEISAGPYVVLGIQPGAAWNEVETAYRTQAKLYHPDRVAGLAPEFIQLAEEKMKRINSAYEELKLKYGTR